MDLTMEEHSHVQMAQMDGGGDGEPAIGHGPPPAPSSVPVAALGHGPPPAPSSVPVAALGHGPPPAPRVGLSRGARGRAAGRGGARGGRADVEATIRGRTAGRGAGSSSRGTAGLSSTTRVIAGPVRLQSQEGIEVHHPLPKTGDAIEWADNYTRIVCELMAEQVRKGNRPNTHLNILGYTEVSERFFQLTGISLSRLQLKNKWDRLKNDWLMWGSLMRNQTGTGWDVSRGVIRMDKEWWAKMKVEIPGCGKFKKKPLQNQEFLSEMFGDISNDETDHWNPMSENPVLPNTQQPFENVEREGEEEEEEEDMVHDWSYREDEEEEVQEVSPMVAKQKKGPRASAEVPKKKQKSGTALIIQEQITKIADSAMFFSSKKQHDVISIKEVMDMVIDCGADYGSNEHDIATQLFVKQDQREMFLTFPSKEVRFNWLTRRYNDKYGK